MTFNPDQKSLLEAPLQRAHVRTRQQGGRSVSYIEGWRAIEEANRIFGFDGWNRETVEIKCVAEREREIGTEKKPGWGVSYTARVRVSVGDIYRDGIGAGHGIDRDLGQAHESAAKEAETDAMKRALMTFGNQFGLALYDKEQTNVQDEAPVNSSKVRFVESCKKTIVLFKDETRLREWWGSEDQKKVRRDFELDTADVTELLEAIKVQIATLQPKSKAA
jgi:DNA recombination protein Rad52